MQGRAGYSSEERADLKKVNKNPRRHFSPSQKKLIRQAKEIRQESSSVKRVFGDRDRIYLRMQNLPASQTQQYCRMYLEKKGYCITNYKKGLATDQERKQQFKIGKLLKDEVRLLEAFRDDETRGSQKKLIVISRNVQDIASMSTNKSWYSCMGADHDFNDYVPGEIKAGSLVAYLISENDMDINNPLARVKILPYFPGTERYNVEGPVIRAFDNPVVKLVKYFQKAISTPAELPDCSIYRADSYYGLRDDNFKAIVQQFLNDNLNKDAPSGDYRQATPSYGDSHVIGMVHEKSKPIESL